MIKCPTHNYHVVFCHKGLSYIRATAWTFVLNLLYLSDFLRFRWPYLLIERFLLVMLNVLTQHDYFFLKSGLGKIKADEYHMNCTLHGSRSWNNWFWSWTRVWYFFKQKQTLVNCSSYNLPLKFLQRILLLADLDKKFKIFRNRDFLLLLQIINYFLQQRYQKMGKFCSEDLAS